ncbi:hypothetical protein OH76DRAFT_357621 [Lentinus brumalis]|uniref:Uncharacterized protein n=1 Tax=Lentinus brumalis TaxID=2498619 RepID=A0A371DF88_9APHY|nr:hypothetical protein OH76DRAFT_357621 [Polyporus brumalis]
MHLFASLPWTTMYDSTAVPPEIWQHILTLACTDGGRACFPSPCRVNSRSTLNYLASASIRCCSRPLNRSKGSSHSCTHVPRATRPSLALLSTLNLRRTHLYSSYPRSDLAAEDKRKALHTRFTDAANELFVLVALTLRTLCLTVGNPLAPFPCAMLLLEELK